MFMPERIVEVGREVAWLVYLGAKAKGIPCPVIELWATDAANLRAITVTAWVLPELLGSLRSRGPRGLEVARGVEMPVPEGYFGAVIDSAQGLYPFNMPMPDDDDLDVMQPAGDEPG